MKTDTNAGEIISLDEAKRFTKAYQKRNPEDPRAFFVGNEKVQKLLAQDDCAGMRIYNGFDEETQTMNQVLIGVNHEGNDQIDGIIIERLVPCPKLCSGVEELIG